MCVCVRRLSLQACVWLEEYLSEYEKCLIIISHSQDFLNGVCTHIIWLTQQKLTYYTGNYDTYLKSVAENRVIQQKKYEKEQEDIKHIKQFIASCGALPAPLRPLRPLRPPPPGPSESHATCFYSVGISGPRAALPDRNVPFHEPQTPAPLTVYLTVSRHVLCFHSSVYL